MTSFRYFTLLLAGVLLSVSTVWAQDNSDSSRSGSLSVKEPVDFVPLASTGYQGIAATSVTVGAQATGLPCFNCVTNQTSINVGLPMPMAVLTHGNAVTITVTFENTTYTGPCSVTYLFKQGTTVLQRGVYNYPSGCNTTSTYNAAYFNTTVPSGSGATVLQGIVKAGSISSSVTLNVTIQ